MSFDPMAVDAAKQAATRSEPLRDPRDPRNDPRSVQGDPRGDPAMGVKPRDPNEPRNEPRNEPPRDPRSAQGDPRRGPDQDPRVKPRVDVEALRDMVLKGKISPEQIMMMVQSGELPPNIVDQLGLSPKKEKTNPQKTVGKSQPNVRQARQVMRTTVRKLLAKGFGTFCNVNSVITTIYCIAQIEGIWRGDGSWSWVGVAIGLLLGLFLFIAQLALSDWDSLGVFFLYFVVLAPDAYMTHVAWYNIIVYPILSHSMEKPGAAVFVAIVITGLWSILSAKASEWAYLGRPVQTLLDRIKGAAA